MSRIKDWAAGSWIKTGLLVVVAVFVVIQLVPYGHSHTNPQVTQAAQFDSPETEQLFSDACGACHSNLTNWPPESSIAPFSWLITSDVDGGRGIFNVSEWDRAAQPESGEIGEVINEGEMPPLQYTLLHPGSRLSDSEKQQLIDGLAKTFAQDPPGP